MNTVLDQKSNILTAFNAVVSQSIAQTLFEQRLALWELMETPYTTIAEFMGIFSIYAPQINVICITYDQITGDNAATRIATYKHDKGTIETTTHTGTDTSTNGEQTENVKNYIYPQGVLTDTDKAYIAAETDSTQPQTINTNERNLTDTRTNSGSDTDTERIYELATFMSQGGELAQRLSDFIAACVFALFPYSASCKRGQ